MVELGQSKAEAKQGNKQTTLPEYAGYKAAKIEPFGCFSDSGGEIPSDRYLTEMLERAVEAEEADADQHTSLILMDQGSLDDSHKITKHIASYGGIRMYAGMLTVQSKFEIRQQLLALTMGHEECTVLMEGIANSMRKYGHSEPEVFFSDNPSKDKSLILSAFPSLGKGLAPMAAAHGLKELAIPASVKISTLTSISDVERLVGCIVSPLLDINRPAAHVLVSVDAEWNLSRTVGCSLLQVAPHDMPEQIFLIPLHKLIQLPPALLLLLSSDRVFKIGSKIKGDLTRLKKQFDQLSGVEFATIDLKDCASERGLLKRGEKGTLDSMCEKFLGAYMEKEDSVRKSNEWERSPLSQAHTKYAALDVYGSRLLYERLAETPRLDVITFSTRPGTLVGILTHQGGDIAAYGTIAIDQPPRFASVFVKTKSNTRLLIDITSIVKPAAGALLHYSTTKRQAKLTKTKAGLFTFDELSRRRENKSAAPAGFSIVSQVCDLIHDQRLNTSSVPQLSNTSPSPPAQTPPDLSRSSSPVQSPPVDGDEEEEDTDSGEEWEMEDEGVNLEFGGDIDENEERDEVLMTLMEDLGIGGSKEGIPLPTTASETEELIEALKKLVAARGDPNVPPLEFTKIKKDLFHAFQMIPLSTTHGMRATFLRMLRDHILVWDPVIRAKIDTVCQKEFKLSFDQMLLKKPRWIARRCPRYVPAPSILVPTIQLVYDRCGNAKDAKTKLPLFSKKAWTKANAVLELAREGFLSDIVGVVLYEEAGRDKYGLMRFWCCRGTGMLEGGPHGDIYQKFGALNASPRLTLACLTDHRTRYNLQEFICQSFAKHRFGVNWDYHHNLGFINRTAFLLNYLSEHIPGADAYRFWTNGDLYERTTETFGICKLPTSLISRLGMRAYDDTSTPRVKLNSSNDWLRRRQGVALPILPPSTVAARQFYFKKLPTFFSAKTSGGKLTFKLEEFAVSWNHTADGVERVYITPELLSAYGKVWDRVNNQRATEDLVSEGLSELKISTTVIQHPANTFPTFITGARQIPFDPTSAALLFPQDERPSSLSISVSNSNPLPHVPSRNVASQPTLSFNSSNPSLQPDLNTQLGVNSAAGGSGLRRPERIAQAPQAQADSPVLPASTPVDNSSQPGPPPKKKPRVRRLSWEDKPPLLPASLLGTVWEVLKRS
ncbi:hypothetical protein P7C70_g5367, partial [Phenoliferia sp. Uapishka_3]